MAREVGESSRTRRLPAGGVSSLVAVLLVALNLRGAIAAVSPVLPEIRADLGLSATTAGLLTAVPVLCFALAAPAAARLARRTGTPRAVLIGCLTIAAATVLRVLDGPPVLLLGTLILGVGMTVGNVLVPVVVKRDFAGQAGTVTGVYTAALAGGAAAAAALTAPLAAVWSWRAALAVWAVLALVAAAVWAATTRRHAGLPVAAATTTAGDRASEAADAPEAPPGGRAPDPRMWPEPLAWAVALFLGCQSICYYAVTAWLPTLLIEDVGVAPDLAGGAMSAFQLLGIGGTLLIPLLSGRRPNQSWLGLGIVVGWVLLGAGLLLWPSAWPAWVAVGGVVQGAGISFAFTVLVLRAHDAAAARSLSSMVQLVGYSLGAAGPVAFGALSGATGGWTAPLLLLLAVSVVMAVSGWAAGRDRTVGAPSAAPAR